MTPKNSAMSGSPPMAWIGVPSSPIRASTDRVAATEASSAAIGKITTLNPHARS